MKKELEEIREKNLFNAQGATIERSVTDRFTCGKCKEKKVSYYQLQTRSADEPLTTSVPVRFAGIGGSSPKGCVKEREREARIYTYIYRFIDISHMRV